MLHIGSQTEPFWDDHLIDFSRTTAEFKVREPQPQEAVLICDEPWEGDGCGNISIVKDGTAYRMYYMAGKLYNREQNTVYPEGKVAICCAESRDGVNWIKPKLGLREFEGSSENNIVLDKNDGSFWSFTVFLDTGPACTPETRYKAITHEYFREGYGGSNLWCYASPDGLHWTKGRMITDKGRLDTANVCFYDHYRNEYMCYIRDIHSFDQTSGTYANIRDIQDFDWQLYVRDIRLTTSKDFITWTDPVPMDFGNRRDYPMYTNCVQRYDRTPHMLLAFPTRYIEREIWTENYDQLPNAELRKLLNETAVRYGMSLSDCVFMCSRDGRKWYRHEDAFISPGIERKGNWVYGDCYPALGMIETKNSLPDAPDELSIYCHEMQWSADVVFRRYSLRKDGFVSLRAGYAEKKVVTTEVIFTGDRMELNFSTSAFGHVHISIKNRESNAAERTITSCELFGNSLNRIVTFDGKLGEFAGKPVTIEFAMSDADIYSMRFFK